MNPQEIRLQFASFQQSRILLTAFELEIFTILDKSVKTSQEISTVIKSDHRATDRLLNALCALGYLVKENDKFSNRDFSAEFLVKGKPGFMSGLYHLGNLWDSWSNMSNVIRTGKPAANPDINEGGDKWLNAFIEAMHNRAHSQAGPSIAQIDLSNVKKVLDVGGGSAAFSMAFVNAKNDIRATVFDLPNVVPITKQYIEAEGYAGKIDTCPGDYNSDDLPTGYDLVFLSAIIHANSFEDNEALIKKCAHALNSGGQLVIQDFIMDNDRTGPLPGAVFALNMITGTAGGDTYTEAEISEWMTKAGLVNIKMNNQPFGTGQITGYKTTKS